MATEANSLLRQKVRYFVEPSRSFGLLKLLI